MGMEWKCTEMEWKSNGNWNEMHGNGMEIEWEWNEMHGNGMEIDWIWSGTEREMK